MASIKLEEHKNAVIQLYEAGTSLMEIAAKYEVSVSTVSNSLDRWGIPRDEARSKPRYRQNNAALDNLDDPQVQRWLDYLAEHARLGKDNVILLSAKPEDVDGVEKLLALRNFLGSNKPLETWHGWRLRLYSEQLWRRIRAHKDRAKQSA